MTCASGRQIVRTKEAALDISVDSCGGVSIPGYVASGKATVEGAADKGEGSRSPGGHKMFGCSP